MASLRDLGLSEYEACAYRALLTTGPTTAKELSRVSDVPMGRIYDVLNGLERQGLARSQAAGRPTKYVAVEPEAALDSLLADRRRELEAERERYERAADELVEDLEAESVGERFWTAAVGPAETADLLVERLAAADERVAVVASRLPRGFDGDTVGALFAEELACALDRGVEVSVLLAPHLVEAVPERVGERLDGQGGDRLSVRASPDVAGTFELIDGRELCIEVAHPLEPERTVAVLDLKDRGFAADVAGALESLWERAEPTPL